MKQVLIVLILLVGMAGSAFADITPAPFTITPSAIGNTNYGSTANVGFKSFNYQVLVTLGAFNADRTVVDFTSTGFTNIQGLSAYNPANPSDTTLNIPGSTTGLGSSGGYSLYETFTLTGHAVSTGPGNSNVTYTGGTLSLYGNNTPGVNLTLGGALPAGSQLIGTAIVTTGEETVCSACTLNQGAYDIQALFTRSGPGAGFLSGSPFGTTPTLMDFNGVLSFIDFSCAGCSGNDFGHFQITGSGNQSFVAPAPATPGTVPEPTTLLLLGSGLVGLAFIRRRARA